MVSLEDVKQIIGDVLQIGDRVDQFTADTALLGSIPEFDSMAVVSILTAFEDRFGVFVDDDEVSAEIFESVGSLQAFLTEKAA